MAIGTFDGVHIGHQEVVLATLRVASEEGLTSTILTFDRHPMALVAPPGSRACSRRLNVKIVLLEGLQPDELVVLPFTRELAADAAPTSSVPQVIAEPCTPRMVVVGANFTFGAGGGGTATTLSDAGRQLGFHTVVVPLATAGGRPISSTRIRRLLLSRRPGGGSPAPQPPAEHTRRRGTSACAAAAPWACLPPTWRWRRRPSSPAAASMPRGRWSTATGTARPSTSATTRPSTVATKRPPRCT